MKYIIKESQEKKILESDNIERKTKMLGQLFNALYPNYKSEYDEIIDHENIVNYYEF
jgi:hypothetical protein